MRPNLNTLIKPAPTPTVSTAMGYVTAFVASAAVLALRNMLMRFSGDLRYVKRHTSKI